MQLESTGIDRIQDMGVVNGALLAALSGVGGGSSVVDMLMSYTQLAPASRDQGGVGGGGAFHKTCHQ